ncbi:polyhydroxyalkanoic acid inclusion protein PhaP [Aneurinibacillus terranovensis]|uniref:polyhydroxyalkanoic acid inclusion protein PhaP n=1 Tax=Aneurinibacillus terranovensis TaxID=278991 RepID=UPI00040B7C99|nr:polyhydroxyalkanoic acid inclusion protein PhaP [Aneurinibacillus terranovensis]
MAINKRPEKENTVNQNGTNIVDSMWDGWMNGIKMLYAYQREMENLTLQTIDRQKEIWAKTTENMEKMEQEVKKFLEDVKENYRNHVSNFTGEQASKVFEDWNSRLEEISNRIQQLTWTPGKAGLTVLNKSNEQVETAIKSLFSQQQKTRDEIQSLIENFLSQVKTTQKGIIETFEVNKNSTMNMFK